MGGDQASSVRREAEPAGDPPAHGAGRDTIRKAINAAEPPSYGPGPSGPPSSRRPFLLAEPGVAAGAAEAARRFLHFYGPASVKDFAAWAGLARSHARRIWQQLGDDLVEVDLDGRSLELLAEDEKALASPPEGRGRGPAAAARSLPAAPRPLRARARARALGRSLARAGRGSRYEIAVEALESIDHAELEAEAARVAELRGVREATVSWR